MSNSSANNRDEVILLNVDKLYKDFNPFSNLYNNYSKTVYCHYDKEISCEQIIVKDILE